MLCSASLCGCISPTKPISHKDPMSEGVASWWLMSWGTAQAGDRASQTGHYGQWWDRDTEQLADSSDRHNLHHSSISALILCASLRSCCCSRPRANVFVFSAYSSSCGCSSCCGCSCCGWLVLLLLFSLLLLLLLLSLMLWLACPDCRKMRGCWTRQKYFADGHTVSNAPDLFRPPKLSGTGPG